MSSADGMAQFSRRGLIAGSTACLLTRYSASATSWRRGRTMFGVNYYDLYYRSFSGRGFTDPMSGLGALQKAGIPFVRFSCSPFWPTEWKAFDGDPDKYLGYLDRVIDAAEKAGIGVIPSLIWYPGGLSDYCGEPMSAWGDIKSETWAYAARYVDLIVSRYNRSSAIWMWEFSNEFNSMADLRGSERFFPKVNVAKGTPSQRSIRDRISRSTVEVAYSHFADLIKARDEGRPISSGANIPRSRMINASLGLTALDTPTQFNDALRVSLAGKTDTLSVHIYPDAITDRFNVGGTSFADLLLKARAVADSRNSGLLVGEFGFNRSQSRGDPKALLAKMIDSIKIAKADYAAFWVYDYIAGDPFNVTFDDQSWVLNALRDANR